MRVGTATALLPAPALSETSVRPSDDRPATAVSRFTVHARSTAAPCLLILPNAGLLSHSSRPTHLWSQNPAQILVPTRPRCTTSEGPWLNPDLVGKWSHSPAKALPFLTQAQPNPAKALPFLHTSPDEHHPNPEPFFQSSLFLFPRFPEHIHLCEK